MRGMLDELRVKSDMEYDVIAGTSAGALNALGVAYFKKGDEDKMLSYMSNRWAHTEQKDLFTQWKPLGVVTGMFFKSGVFNSAGMLESLEELTKEFNSDLKRDYIVTAIDANDGSIQRFSGKNKSQISREVYASASIPVFLPPTRIGDRVLEDIRDGNVQSAHICPAITVIRENRNFIDAVSICI